MNPPRAHYLYNPGLLSDDEVTQVFSVRMSEFAQLTDNLRTTSERPAHHVIVGPRGSGKSTLLRRIACEVTQDKRLNQQWIALEFAEEQYNVDRLSVFLLNTARALCEALTSSDTETAVKLEESLSDLPSTEEAAQRALVELLGKFTKRSRKRLVLLVDNLDELLGRLKDDEWSFRSFLNENKWVAIIGASTSIFESSYNYGAAFYDFFQIHELHALDETETNALLHRLADYHHAPAVKEILHTTPNRIKALHKLTGGHVRTIASLYQVLARTPNGEIEADLKELLDISTPLYKARIEALSPQQQTVFTAVAMHWAPATARQIADALRSDDVNMVSTQLNRLLKARLIEKVDAGGSRDAYQLVERIFNIWCLMRMSPKARQQVLWLIEFLRGFYGTDQLIHDAKELLRRPIAEDPANVAAQIRLMLARASTLDPGPLHDALERTALTAAIEQWGVRHKTIEALFDFDKGESTLVESRDAIATMQEMRRQIFELRDLPADISHERLWEKMGGDIRLNPAVRLNLVTSWSTLELGLRNDHIRRCFADGDTHEIEFFNFFKADDTHCRTLVRKGLIRDHSDLRGATIEQIKCPNIPIVQPFFALAASDANLRVNLQSTVDVLPMLRPDTDDSLWVRWITAASKCEIDLSTFSAAVEVLSPTRESYWLSLMDLWLDNLTARSVDPRSEAVQDVSAPFLKALALRICKLFDSSAKAHWIYGQLLLIGGQVEEALKEIDRAAALDATRSDYPLLAGFALQVHLKQFDKAYTYLHRALQLNPDRSLEAVTFAYAARLNGKTDEAVQALRNLRSPNLIANLLLCAFLGEVPSAHDERHALLQTAAAMLNDPALPTYSVHSLDFALMSLASTIDDLASMRVIARHFYAKNPDHWSFAYALARVEIRLGNWSEAWQPLSVFLRHSTPSVLETNWEVPFWCFEQMTTSELARRGMALIEEHNLASKWQSLHLALSCVANSSDEILKQAPAEIAVVACEVLARIKLNDGGAQRGLSPTMTRVVKPRARPKPRAARTEPLKRNIAKSPVTSIAAATPKRKIRKFPEK